jgi:hypothetical protein
MAAPNEQQSDSGATGLEELRKEISNFLHNMAHEWVEKAGDKASGLTERLSGMAEDEGGVAAAGARMLHGESPGKAMFKQKTKDTKDKVMGKAKEALPGAGGGGGGGGGGEIKATNIIEMIDVGVPVRIAYDQWTQLEDFPGFTKGVQTVSQDDDVTSQWTMKIAFSSRSWKATVQEQVPDERIRWTSEGAKGTTTGVISFHEVLPDLTRIMVVIEYYPAGFFEKTGNLWRAQGRRVRLDLKHFARHVTMHADEEIEGWRGEIQDGEVTRSHEEGLEDDNREDDQDGDQGEDEYEKGGGDQAEDEFDEDEDQDQGEGEDEDEDEDEADQPSAPPRRSRAKR